ncbi:hypothetical protein LTR91_009608 [Friedmanniomyces endolithicus]|uniref:FCP1 homology domain-containing protein n=1 Tax=Friedmanniomyces endolithicus TaxID=329885 RepID=A0AAN6JE04_9PEZI|nr:hypothetical protein LTS09_017086 [Friedmanniomyces endolithicus]KAK0278959.1 hypothetical protein LTS00_013571 [Friedmanniomyces endolithicus]KAK0279539.1 hypothetical protein LTR35_008729 [Friedmanniomyces endolithicus]KAK0320918.1 hypothetical protein LTR82_008237 [Friedmanniomyces endolithicus]KAK0920093.1 hypothetical protein LTR57_010137 [Friedmanniomyces endolithicus]
MTVHTVPLTLAQPVAPPPRTTSREPSVPGDGISTQRATGSSRGQDVAGGVAGPTLGVPGSSDQRDASTGLSGATASGPAESIGRGSKRSLTGRRRDGSTGSKRSNQAAASNEKAAGPDALGRTQATSQPSARPKKKRGLMAILCCSSSEDTDDHDMQGGAQAPKPVVMTQSSRVQQTAPSPQQVDTSVPGTSAEESREGFNEKAVPPSQPNVEAILPANEFYQPPPQLLDPTMEKEKPMPAVPIEELPARSNPESQSPETLRQPVTLTNVVVGPAHIDSSSDAPALPHGTNPHGLVQAPIPVSPHSREDEPIADQTPKQRAQDDDIEMQDANAHLPHVPLTTKEAAAIAAGTVVAGAGAAAAVEGKRFGRNSAESSRDNPVPTTLPPPPGPPPTQSEQPQPEAQREYDGTVQSQQEPAPAEEGRKWLLGPLRPEFRGRKCLVLDLDETLVHSSFKASLSIHCAQQILHQADFTIPVEIEGQYHNVYVIKRPGVDAFMKRVGELYEVVVFTASVSKYGDPLLDQLDIHNVVHHRLFRESCYNHQGNYVKDLSMMGRDLRETIIIDNSPTSYIFHPQHAVPISSWFSDAHDNELLDLIPVLEDLASSHVSDVSLVLDVAL